MFAWEPQLIDSNLLRGAREIERRHALSWWDSMIVAAAQLQNCALLLTEDLQDGWHCGGVTVCNPFTSQVADERARYSNTPTTVSRHRPRGRPRRDTSTA